MYAFKVPTSISNSQKLISKLTSEIKMIKQNNKKVRNVTLCAFISKY